MVEGQAVRGRRGIFRVLAIVTVLLLPLGIGVLAHRLGYQCTQDTGIIVKDKLRMVESLVVKIAYHPELARYIGAVSSGREQVGYKMIEVGGFVKIERFTGSGEVKITVGNETVGTFKADELKANVKLLNLTVQGLPLKIAVAVCNIPYTMEVIRNIPDEIRKDALGLLENHAFTRWLREEGFGYAVKEVIPIFIDLEPLISNYTILGAVVSLRVEDLDILYHLYFDKPYILTVNSSIPEELKVSPYEKDNYGIYLICDYIYEVGGFIGFFPHPASRNITRPEDPFFFRRELNITNEIREEVLRIMKGNRVLAKLLDSPGCEIKKISGWEIKRYETYKTVSVILVCDRIKGYGINVRIDLIAGKIKEVYIYDESTIYIFLDL